MHGGMCRGAWRCTGGAQRWAKVHRGVLKCIGLQRGAQRCAEVHRGVCRGVRRCMERYVDVWRCMDRCAVVHGGVQRCMKGVYEGVQRYVGMSGGVNWLPLPTVDLVGDNRKLRLILRCYTPFGWLIVLEL